jgi:hypothetical protein
VPLHLAFKTSHPTRVSLLLIPLHPAQTDAKYIGFREGGFLQVAVSEAPHLRASNCALLPRGALQIMEWSVAFQD